MYQPLVGAALARASENTVFDSAGLRLIAIPALWTLALKLRRYTPADEEDIKYILRSSALSTNLPPEHVAMRVEERLRSDCKEMDYDIWPPEVLKEMGHRLVEGVSEARKLRTRSQSYSK